jgi:hypothetical protein
VTSDDTPGEHDDGHSVLLARRHRYTGTQSFYRCGRPGPVPLSKLIAIASARWRIEEDHQLITLTILCWATAQSTSYADQPATSPATLTVTTPQTLPEDRRFGPAIKICSPEIWTAARMSCSTQHATLCFQVICSELTQLMDQRTTANTDFIPTGGSGLRRHGREATRPVHE